MSRILGLDIGANSIGWALIDDEGKKIIGAGVRVFKEGVNIDKGTREESKNATRREARGMRRRNKRKRQRLDNLTSILKLLKMYPQTDKELKEFFYQGRNESINPYELRKKGLNEQLSLMEFGRVLYHICRRRGFKSNRKTDAPDAGSKIEKGYEGIIGISTTREEIIKGGFKTVGEYLSSLNPHNIRRRNRFIERKMYEEEFEKIWEKQSAFYSNVLTNELKTKIANAIFLQRPLKSQKWTVKNCELEPDKKVTPKSSPIFQYFRILQQVNTIRVSIFGFSNTRHNEPLTAEERTILINELMKKDKYTFEQIRKLLRLPRESEFNYKDDEKLIGNRTYSPLIPIFGKNRWTDMTEDEKEAVWYTVYIANTSEWLADYARKKLNLDDESIKKLLKVHLEKEYAQFSRRALKNLIPFLEEGLSVTEAKEKAGYTESDTEKQWNLLPMLPVPLNIRNPIVQQALYELKRVINTIINLYKKPDLVRIELTRELKNPKTRRIEIRFDNLKREKEYKEYEEFLKKEFGFTIVMPDDILKYRLWKELYDERSPYSGEKIPINRLFSAEVEIDHILPYSKSLNDSYMNKTLCYRNENQEKVDQTPYEAFSSEQQRYDEIIFRIKKSTMDYKKKKLFWLKEIPEDFINRQLNDTAYITKETKKYLTQVFPKVEAVSGGTTALLRRYWGLNSILGGRDKKSRDDHRHHTIDALVVANTTAGFVHRLSRYHEYRSEEYLKSEKAKEKFEKPWITFWQDAEIAVKNIFVSHRCDKKVSGKLHEETYYGKIKAHDGSEQYVVRKKLETLDKKKQVEAIVDPVVRQQVINRLVEKGINMDSDYTFKKDVFKEPLFMPDGIMIKKVRIYVPSTEMIQLYKGRKTFVEPGGNHHIAIFENEQGKREGDVITLFDATQRVCRGEPVIQKTYKPGWKFVMSLSIDEMVIMDVNENEIDWNDTNLAFIYFDKLYRVQKMDINKIITFRKHTTARLQNDNKVEIGRLFKNPNTLKAIKVKIDPIGRIRPAYD